MPWLINAAQLDKFRKSQKNIIIFDASYHLPDAHRDAKREFLEKHILDSQFFDLSLLNDQNGMLMRDENSLNEKLGILGVRNDYKIIFYDNSDLHSSFRAAWMMKVVGHHPQSIYVLDGGLAAWEKYGGKVESGEPRAFSRQYQSTLQPQWIRTLSQMKENLHQPTQQVIDLRHSLRFAGGGESRPGVRSGHIRGSYCLPYTLLFDANNNLHSLEKIRKMLDNIGIDINSPIVSMCGGAVTACILDFALDLMNHKNHTVYEGSWREWGSEKLYPGETNLDERPVKKSTD